jgi:acetylornithine deacetylase/succinyl-diaminopimelate desuccinylase-like protein
MSQLFSAPALLVLSFVASWTPHLPASSPDFDAVRDEAVSILRDLVRIDTTSPPGNETEAALYLQRLLASGGIESRIHGKVPHRGNLVARVRGNGSKPPILLMGHTDVVGAESEQWSVEPFAAEVRDGYIYGRGTIDDKDSVTAGVMTLLLLKRLGIALDRDVIFLAEASEEGGSNVYGIGYMIREHFDEIDAEFALAEGGAMPMRGGEVRYVAVATTEKRIMRLHLKARGQAGHGSVPVDDNAITDLAAAVARIGRYRAPIRLNETTRTFFERLASISPDDEADVLHQVLDPARRDAAVPALRRIDPAYDSMLRTSFSPTIINGGFRYNVIPGAAEATIDLRMLQDDDVESVAATVRRLIDNPRIEFEIIDGGRPPGPASPLDTVLFRALERVQSQMFPNAITMPRMLNGATDMAQVRAAGIPAYGIGPPTPEGESRAHGHDERIGIQALGDFVEFVYRTVIEVAASRQDSSDE